MRADRRPSLPTDDDQDLVLVPRARLEALEARLAEHDRRLGAMEAPPAAPSRPSPPDEGIGRRRALLGIAGVAAGAAAAVASSAQPAAAANGSNIVIGSDNNTGTAHTGLSVQGSAALYGFGVTDDGASTLTLRPAIFGHGKGQNFAVGVYGQGQSEQCDGVVGEGLGIGSDGVVGHALSTGDGVVGTSVEGYGGRFSTQSGFGSDAAVSASAPSTQSAGGTCYSAFGTTHVHLLPNARPIPPSDTLPGQVGQLRWTTSGGALWACTASGTPGTWRKLVGTGTAGAFHLLPAPVRIYDSRPSSTPAQGPKTPLPAGNVARTIDCKHNGSGVPAGATGVVITVLLANAATGNGNLTIWANDKPKPQSNTMVWGGNSGRFTATALSALDAQARIKIDASLQTNVILDVVGYYR
ncbi:MAG TPA: hypothetical protein VF228_00465 [Iamia sp.]